MQINEMEMETEPMEEDRNSNNDNKETKDEKCVDTSKTSDVESMEHDGHLTSTNGKNEIQDDKSDDPKVNISEPSTEESSDSNEPSVENFKKPVLLIGPRRGKPVKSLQTCTDNELKPEKENSSADDLKDEESKEDQRKKQSVPEQIPLPYTEPAWSGKPTKDYKFEVLKSGVIVEKIELNERNYHVVGRLPTCHVSLAHPTVSRYHAIFQFRTIGDEKNGPGLYVYDLGSTHGTFWNGNRIRPNVYVRVQGGHMIKFGCSQRKFILQAPADDQEEESELSATELKERRKLEMEERERIETERRLEQEELERLEREKEEADGVNWGMGEDADEETDLTENPFAQSNNEELFLDDPKKTLRGWFEREGYDLQYHTEDKGIGRFLCWVDLPIEHVAGGPARAEATVVGKKKESVIQCALDACRILDRYGLLRQATHEAKKRKAKNWEEEDFYDSDEDNFLDRTGSIEKKRQHRMKMAGKLDSKVETYTSLLEKHSIVTKKISDMEKLLESKKRKEKKVENSDEDALDAFMSTLDTSSVDKIELKKMKLELQNLRKEETQLLKLINIAKPANLPPLKPFISNTTKSTNEERFKNMKSLVGHKRKATTSIKLAPVLRSQNEASSDDVVEEDEMSEEEKEVSEEVESEMKDANDKVIEEKEESKITEENLEETEVKEIDTEENCEDINEKIDDTEERTDETEETKESLRRKKRNMKRLQQRQEKASKELEKGYESDKFREDYSMWVPPEDQSGDGKTSLNDKYGY